MQFFFVGVLSFFAGIVADEFLAGSVKNHLVLVHNKLDRIIDALKK